MKLVLPYGVRDIEGSYLEKEEYYCKKLLELFKFYSYSKIYTPTFEYFNVFDTDFTNTKDMYFFSNKDGELLGLRNDITKSIRRVVYQQRPLVLPIKYCYSMKRFLNMPKLKGELHEITQCGIELIGDKSYKSDIEVIKLAILSLKRLGYESFFIHLSDNRFFKTFIDDFSLDDEVACRLKDLILKKNLCDIVELLKTINISDDVRNIITKLLVVVGNIGLVNDLKELMKNTKTCYVLEYLEKIYKGLGELSKYLKFDFSLSSYEDYYTGIFFMGYLDGVGKEIISGGRYDDFITNPELNFNIPAIGFAINVDYALMHSDSFNAIKNDILYFYSDDYYSKMEQELEELMNQENTSVYISKCLSFEDAIEEFKASKQFMKFIYYCDGKRGEIIGD